MKIKIKGNVAAAGRISCEDCICAFEVEMKILCCRARTLCEIGETFYIL